MPGANIIGYVPGYLSPAPGPYRHTVCGVYFTVSSSSFWSPAVVLSRYKQFSCYPCLTFAHSNHDHYPLLNYFVLCVYERYWNILVLTPRWQDVWKCTIRLILAPMTLTGCTKWSFCGIAHKSSVPSRISHSDHDYQIKVVGAQRGWHMGGRNAHVNLLSQQLYGLNLTNRPRNGDHIIIEQGGRHEVYLHSAIKGLKLIFWDSTLLVGS